MADGHDGRGKSGRRLPVTREDVQMFENGPALRGKDAIDALSHPSADLSAALNKPQVREYFDWLLSTEQP
jgi:hypothetical protein